MDPKITTEICAYINETHKAYVARQPGLTEKASNDDDLQWRRVHEHIRLIVGMLKESGVIDHFEDHNLMNEMGTADEFIVYALKKNGCHRSVYVITDGRQICLRDASFMISYGNLQPNFEYLPEVKNVDEYDWNNFAKILLDFIHIVVYNRKRVNEMAFFAS